MLTKLFTVAVLLATLLAASVSHSADLMLLDRAAPSTGVVRLADIAAILNAGPDEIDRLGRLPIMPAPAPGTTQTIRAQGVRELLAAHGVELSELRFRGADQVEVVSRFAAPAEVYQAAETAPESFVQSHAPQTGFRSATTNAAPAASVARPYAVRLTSQRRQQLVERLGHQLTQYVQQQTRDPMLHVIEVEIKDTNASTLAAHDSDVVISTTTSLGLGLRRFLIEFDTTRGEVKFPVTGRVVQARPAVMVRRDVPRGMTITAADVHLAPLPLDYRTRGLEVVAENVDEVIGKEAAQRLSVGDVVTDQNSLPPLMVERGELVTVVAGAGAIRVRARAKALRPGRYGEIIEVQTIDTRKSYEARVIGRGQLAVLSAGVGTVQSIASRVEPLNLR